MQPITISKVATIERHRCRRGREGAGVTGCSVSAAATVETCERRSATSARSRSSSARSSAVIATSSGNGATVLTHDHHSTISYYVGSGHHPWRVSLNEATTAAKGSPKALLDRFSWVVD